MIDRCQQSAWAVRDPGLRVILVRCLTVAKVDSMVLVGCHR